MFDFAWSEIVLVAVVALVLIGPKDLPVAIRAVSGAIRRMRRMAAEFQSHVDEMVREADMAGMRDVIDDVRALDLRGQMTRIIDPDRSMARAFNDPFKPEMGAGSSAGGPAAGFPMAQAGYVPPSSTVGLDQLAAGNDAPAFIPPSAVPPAPIQPHAQALVPPAFVPPGTARED